MFSQRGGSGEGGLGGRGVTWNALSLIRKRTAFVASFELALLNPAKKIFVSIVTPSVCSIACNLFVIYPLYRIAILIFFSKSGDCSPINPVVSSPAFER